MVYTHGEVGIFLLKDTGELNKVCPTAQVAGFGEIAVVENVARAQMDKPSAAAELARHLYHVVVNSGRKASGT